MPSAAGLAFALLIDLVTSAKPHPNKGRAMSQILNNAVAVIGIDIGKNSFQVLGLGDRGAMTLRQKWSHWPI
jgi:hypothetical protein